MPKTTTSIERFTVADKRRLDKLEAVIERNLAEFVEVGHALMEIKGEGPYTKRLYRIHYETWADYLDERWDGLSTRHADELVRAAEVVESFAAEITERVAKVPSVRKAVRQRSETANTRRSSFPKPQQGIDPAAALKECEATIEKLEHILAVSFNREPWHAISAADRTRLRERWERAANLHGSVEATIGNPNSPSSMAPAGGSSVASSTPSRIGRLTPPSWTQGTGGGGTGGRTGRYRTVWGVGRERRTGTCVRAPGRYAPGSRSHGNDIRSGRPGPLAERACTCRSLPAL